MEEIAMATETTRARSGFGSYAWTVFVGMGVLLMLSGLVGLFGHPSHGVWVWSLETSLKRENSLNELLIGLFGVVIAVNGLRHGERWAWFAMLLWPVWIIAQNWRDWATPDTGEAGSIFDSFLALAAGPLFVI
jgi:hypothetical protein